MAQMACLNSVDVTKGTNDRQATDAGEDTQNCQLNYRRQAA